MTIVRWRKRRGGTWERVDITPEMARKAAEMTRKAEVARDRLRYGDAMERLRCL